MNNITWDIDISDTYDTQALDAWPIAPIDYTAEIPHPVPDEEWNRRGDNAKPKAKR